MTAWQCLRRYLCTLPLLNLLMLLRVWLWDVIPGKYADSMLLLLLLPGVLFLIGMLAGLFWGGQPGLRWWTVAAYSLVSLLACPLQYYFMGDSGLFWLMFCLLGGQQGAGFLIGAWWRMDSAGEQARRDKAAAQEDGETGRDSADRRWFG